MNKATVCDFFYNCNRGNHEVERKLYFILQKAQHNERKYLLELSVLYRLIAQTRDIINGKGERELAYMQIYCWWHFYPELAIYAFIYFFYAKDSPLGSWKDIKYFCGYVYRKSGYPHHPLILRACNILIRQLTFDKTSSSPSLAAKWCPREKKKYDWLYNIIAFYYHPRATPHTEKSFTWTKMSLRKTIATINRRLKTVEIDMCDRKWDDIQYRNTPSIAMTRYHQCFEKRAPKKTHQYLLDLSSNNTSINGQKSNIYDLVRGALRGNSELIEMQWQEYIDQIRGLNCVPIIDLSSLVAVDPVRLYTAIGLGIIVSEKHKGDFKNRVMVFSGKSEWVNLEGLSLKVKIQRLLGKIGGEPNVYKPLEFISHSLKLLKVDKGEVEGLQLLIVANKIQYSEIKKIFEDMPRLTFWNMGRGGVPCDIDQERVVVLSGYNPILLNTLCGNHRKTGKITPWSRLIKIVDHERYDVLDKKIRDYFS